MVRTDWDRVLSANVSSLTDEEIEDLFPIMVHCDIDEISDVHNLRTLMRISQEMLTYKDNQVETLLLECGELKEAITSLHSESDKWKIKDRDTSAIKQESNGFTNDTDLQKGTRYLDAQEKNGKVKILMDELENVDKENENLKRQLTVLKEEMMDATGKINETVEKLHSTQMKAVEYQDKTLKLEQENAALVTQIEEITTQQIDRDRMLDEFGIAIDARIFEWKGILDEKDMEIERLKESLSQFLMQSFMSIKEENKSQIIYLNDEISRRNAIITELQSKLSEAVSEIDTNAALIEKLKEEIQKSVKNGKGKEGKSLLKKLQSANEKLWHMGIALSEAQNDAKSRSSKLCDVLSTLKKYKDGNEALTKALNDIKDLRIEADNKNKHIEELINVINKLEMLNSHQEMEILALREKLNIPEDESVSIENITAKRKEESRKMKEFIQQNKSLLEKNMELKSDVRMLKHKLSKFEKKLDISDHVDDSNNQFLHSTKLMESVTMCSNIDTTKVDENIQILIEENEALRTGMHEILDSIRNQDGKSEVEIQSSTLERLLEALDVRHLAGWYHPAMRLQEHLNVVQGSNTELRSQIKILRKELQKKDTLLQDLATNKNADLEIYKKCSEEDEMAVRLTEMKALETAYKNEAEEWEKQKDVLIQENNELKGEIDDFKTQLEIYQENWQIIQNGDQDEIKKAFALKTREYVDATNKTNIMYRKNASLQQLLNKETSKLYECQKDIIKKESDLNRANVEANKQNKMLLSEISLLQSNLCNSVSLAMHNELREKYQELNIRYHALLEIAMVFPNYEQVSLLKTEIDAIQREKYQLVQDLKKMENHDVESNVDDLRLRLKEVEAMKLIESQRADRMVRLHEISETQLAKCEENVKRFSTLNSEQQEKLIELHKTLFEKITQRDIVQADDNHIQELQNEKTQLLVENENLRKMLEISQEEARSQYSLNSLQMLELDSLRHQILDLQAISEDKTTISRLNFELTSKKVSEMEFAGQKTRLQNEVSLTRRELEDLKIKYEEMRNYVQEYRKQCDNRCKYYADIIYFLQCQYAGSTSISVLDHVVTLATKLKIDRQNIDAEMQTTKKCHEDIKSEQQLLSVRLEIVERLKDILEQHIGAGNVQNIMERFAETSQQTLNDFKYKRRISYLEHELQIANKKFNDYESTITNMEQDMLNIQKAWHQQHQRPQINTSTFESKSIQVAAPVQVVSIQTDSYNCCLNKTEDTTKATAVLKDVEKPAESNKTIEKTFREAGNNTEENTGNSVISNEQLTEALKLASERSAILVKYEAQLTEYKVKLDTLNKTIEEKDLRYQANLDTLNKMIEEKDSHLAEEQNVFDEFMRQSCTTNADCTDKLALKSTINSLQKLISQKEETISRYQSLLKEDRDEHDRMASNFQDEIKHLHDRILAMQGKVKTDERSIISSKSGFNNTLAFNDGKTTEEPMSNAAQEEIARLREKVSTLEAELNISRELSERWHRLAEERLKHMDHTRERLEQQHKDELDSYRDELNKSQTEVDMLRQQLSENRMLLAKGNISLMKELQEKDDKIYELHLARQELQNKIELMESIDRPRQEATIHKIDINPNETAQFIYRNQTQHQEQVSLLRRQLESLMQKEKMYKYEITGLKQRLSSRYMSIKSQEKKTSQREAQLERKVSSLEEELHKMKMQLDQKYLAQEAKKAKTAEELLLWEKQKKWQQTAEKLKESLKEKTNKYDQLFTNYEKLRSVVSCMEREKWYLRSKLKVENDAVYTGNSSSRPTLNIRHNDRMEELEKECRILRERVKELTDRLEKENNEHLMLEIAELKRHNAILATVSQDNSCIINQLEKLEMTKDTLEKINLRLESENFELRLELEKVNSDIPGLREKVEHMEKYIKLLKAETSSDSTKISDKELAESSFKNSTFEMEKTIFTLKRIIEKLQVENKRLKFNSKKNNVFINRGKSSIIDGDITLQNQYEESQKRVINLESDLRLAEHRVTMLQKAQKEDDNGDFHILKQQLIHKSKLLEKVKQLLTRALASEKALRQRIQQLESKQTKSTIPECYVTSPTPE